MCVCPDHRVGALFCKDAQWPDLQSRQRERNTQK